MLIHQVNKRLRRKPEKERERKNACYMQRPLNLETTFTLKIRLFDWGSNNALSMVPIVQAARGWMPTAPLAVGDT